MYKEIKKYLKEDDDFEDDDFEDEDYDEDYDDEVEDDLSWIEESYIINKGKNKMTLHMYYGDTFENITVDEALKIAEENMENVISDDMDNLESYAQSVIDAVVDFKENPKEYPVGKKVPITVIF